MVKMKFVVPFKIPAISMTSLAARHWLIGRMIGMPPPTLASKRKFTFFSCATFKSSAPFVATNSLLDVTTLLPASMQRIEYSNAGCKPPITSTTTRTSGSFTISSNDLVNLSAKGLSGNSRKSRIYLIPISSFARFAMWSVCVVRTSTTPEPTTP